MNKKKLPSIVILVVLVVFYIIIQLNKSTEKRIDFFEVDSTQIAGIKISSLEDTIQIKKNNGTWMIVEPIEYKAADNMVKAIFDNVLSIEASKTPLADKKSSHVFYNVTDSLASYIAFLDEQGKELDAAYIGESSNYNYSNARKPNDTKVYQLFQNISYNVRPSLYSWRSKKILELPREQITELEISGEEYNYKLTATDSLWQYSSSSEQFTIPEQNSALNSIINSLASFNTTNFVDDNYSEYENQFKNPQLKVKVKLYDGTEHLLSFIPYEENKFLVNKDEGKQHLFVLSSSKGKIFQKDADEFKK
ncbi:MAG: DUF4340 domain-containing protein [Candidatus Cloacimonadota bacterium]|nr:DUF4340 domain-containing protein [Candidatus Cloacimonadota bacterium]